MNKVYTQATSNEASVVQVVLIIGLLASRYTVFRETKQTFYTLP